MTLRDIDTIAEKVLQKLQERTNATFEVEASGRHVHLSEEHLKYLIGNNTEFVAKKYLSQPGEFASQVRVTLIGPKGHLNNVVVLGPTRPVTQVELSLTDANAIGIKAPVRLSGDIEGTPGITIVYGNKSLTINQGVIVAKRHIHVKKSEAEALGVTDKEIVKVKVFGERPLIFDDVVVRISEKFNTYMHIDYDEANACGHKAGTKATIVRG